MAAGGGSRRDRRLAGEGAVVGGHVRSRWSESEAAGDHRHNAGQPESKKTGAHNSPFQFAFRARLRNASPPPRRSAAKTAIVFTAAPLLTRRPSLDGRSVGPVAPVIVRFASTCRLSTALYLCAGAAETEGAAIRPDAVGPFARSADDGEGPGSTCCEGPG